MVNGIVIVEDNPGHMELVRRSIERAFRERSETLRARTAEAASVDS